MTYLFIVQATSQCNLNCKYCYIPKKIRQQKNKMTRETLKEVTNFIINTSNNEKTIVSWHSGEPLMAGIDFYEDAMELLSKNINITHNIQTNATLIDDDWCALFKNQNISVTISSDGPEFIHNQNRVNWSNRGSFLKVEKGINKLKQHSIPLTAICVLSEKSLKYPKEIFNYFLNHNFKSVAFNIEEIEGQNIQSSVLSYQNNDSFLKKKQKCNTFFKTILKLWFKHNQPFILRDFGTMFKRIKNLLEDESFFPYNTQAIAGSTITIDYSGNFSTFSPEFIDYPEFHLGNVKEYTSFEQAKQKVNCINSLQNEINSGIEKCAQSCEFFKLCGGGAPSNKYFENKTLNSSETRFCELSIKTLADAIISQQQ